MRWGTHVCVCVCARVHTHTHTRVCMRARTHTHTHTHTHMCDAQGHDIRRRASRSRCCSTNSSPCPLQTAPGVCFLVCFVGVTNSSPCPLQTAQRVFCSVGVGVYTHIHTHTQTCTRIYLSMHADSYLIPCSEQVSSVSYLALSKCKGVQLKIPISKSVASYSEIYSLCIFLAY